MSTVTTMDHFRNIFNSLIFSMHLFCFKNIVLVNTSKPRQDGRHLTDDLFKLNFFCGWKLLYFASYFNDVGVGGVGGGVD